MLETHTTGLAFLRVGPISPFRTLYGVRYAFPTNGSTGESLLLHTDIEPACLGIGIAVIYSLCYPLVITGIPGNCHVMSCDLLSMTHIHRASPTDQHEESDGRKWKANSEGQHGINKGEIYRLHNSLTNSQGLSQRREFLSLPNIGQWYQIPLNYLVLHTSVYHSKQLCLRANDTGASLVYFYFCLV